MSDPVVIKLRLALMGRPVRNYRFDKPSITIGRDPESDVYVDNPGVSREHFRLERIEGGEYQIVDLGSANGTFLNDQMVHTAPAHNNDVVRFGKYTLWIGYEQDRRATGAEPRRPGSSGGGEQNTVVLSRSELGNLLEVAREKEQHPASPPSVMMPAPAPAPPAAARPAPIAAVVIAFLLGAGLGAGAVWLLMHR